MLYNKIGYNIHTEDNDLKGHVAKLHAPVHLVLENYGLAHDLAVANPDSVIIYRPYFPQSDAYHTIMRPNEFVARMQGLWKGEPNIMFHTGNEAGLGLDLQRWEMALAASPAGMKFVLGNPATGTFPDSVEGWKYAHEYIKFLVNNKDKFWLGLHEYFEAIPCLTMPNFPSRIFNWSGGLNRPAWHVGRFQWLTDYCDMFFGGQYPNIVITEHGNDDLRENRDGSSVNAFLDKLIKNPAYYNLRGWKTFEPQWQAWYKEPADVTYYKMVEWCNDNVYKHPAIKGVCVFAWCSQQSGWEQFNVAYADLFRKYREEASNAVSVELLVTSAGIYNMREGMSTNTKVLHQFKVGEQFYVDEVLHSAGGYMWATVRWGTLQGYVRSDVLKYYTTHVATMNGYRVNIRSDASTQSRVLALLGSGDTFILTGRTSGDWVEVIRGDIRGWCSTSVLTYK